MSERLHWEPEKPEEEPYIRLKLNNDREYELTRDNATLHTFMGRLAVFNHVFYADVHDEEVEESFYLFSDVKGFETIQGFMQEREYPQVLNQSSVSPVDQDAYIRQATARMPDHVPEDWSNDEK